LAGRWYSHPVIIPDDSEVAMDDIIVEGIATVVAANNEENNVKSVTAIELEMSDIERVCPSTETLSLDVACSCGNVESTWFPVNVNADETLLDESIDISLLV
jgi:hypothetical protein